MKKKTMHLMCAMLSALLLAGTAFAADTGSPPIDAGGGTVGDFGDDTPAVPSSSGSSSVRITFVDEDGYSLSPAEKTTRREDGSIRISVRKRQSIKPELIPEAVRDDAYYKLDGWAVVEADGSLRRVDLKTETFTKETTIVALAEDIWTPYNDMNPNRTDWYYHFVRDLSIEGVVSGVPGYNFAPKKEVTWGEALRLVMCAVGYENQPATDAHWASGYLAKALKDSLLDQAVDLNAPITRLDFAKLTRRAMKLDESKEKSPFADTEDGSAVALYEAGIVVGTIDKSNNRNFMPDQNISRAEISTIIWNINNVSMQ